jgi:ABC-type transport system involved in cytochrome bd biosynthesis fused ATPase/permease subunit
MEMNKAAKEHISQRRQDDAVDGVGVIETGLSNCSASYTAGFKTMSTRSGLNASGKNCQNTDKSLTTDASSRIGAVVLKKCEAKPALANRLLSQMSLRPIRTTGDVSCSTTATSSDAKKILHPMRVNIPEGSITAVLGTSESGKSTLLKFMAGCADRNLHCDGVGE